MSLTAWQSWFGDQFYRAILVISTLEGLGLPVPTEVLFLPGVAMATHGEITLTSMVLLATLGNTLGGLTGFAVAYFGGSAFFKVITGWLGIRHEAQRRMESFFARYGETTVFLSRFIGIIRAVTIYSAGAARMSPLRFAIYLTAAGLVWNAGWVLVIRRFRRVAFRLLDGHGGGRVLFLVLGLLLAMIAVRHLYRMLRRKPTGS